jgi:hypothetical protein
MRNTRFFFGVVFALSALLVASSCRDRLEEFPAGEGEEMTLLAGSPGTRTVNDGLRTLWADGDVITALYGPTGGSQFRSNPFRYVGDNLFRGRVHELVARNDWFLIYPYRSDIVDPTAVRVSVASDQTQAGADSTGHLAGPDFPLVGSARSVAQSATPSVTMTHVLSCLRIPVTNTTDAPIVVKQIEITMPVPVTGEFGGDITVSPVSWSPMPGASSQVTLTVANGKSIRASAQAPFYVGIAPVTLPAGSRMTVKVTAVHPSAPSTEIAFYKRISFAEARTLSPGSIISMPLSFDENHQEDLDPRRTYRYQSTPEEGTYLLLGYEPTSSSAPGAYICLFPPTGQECAQVKFADDPGVTMIVTEDETITRSEVELSQSGSGWLIKSKANGRYLYYAGGAVSFTSDASVAVHTFSSGTNGFDLNNGGGYFYHSGSGGVFKYRSSSGACNIRLFKLGDNVPEYPDGTYSVENDQVALYLTYMENHPYDIDDRSQSVIENYCSGVSESNRMDWPKPVPVSWTNPSSGNTSKTVSIYNDASCTQLETSVSVNASAVTAEVYNLIPGRTYYYVVRNGSTSIKEGQFETVGRRRMMKIGSDFNVCCANNCRDLGGQVTTDGRTIRYGRIYRGTNVDQVSTEARNLLLNYMKIGLDVDLRNTGYYNQNGDFQYDGLNLGDIPLYNANIYQGHTVETFPADSYDIAVASLTDSQKMGTLLTRIMNAVLNGTNVYVHCRIGADRTGFACMMLEAILGVPLERCEIDYELTSFSKSGLRTRGGTQDGIYFIASELIKEQSGSTFQQKAVNFAVNNAGVDSGLITRFQNAMLVNNQ